MNGKIIVDGTTKVQAFEAGEVDALDAGGLPPDEIARLEGDARVRGISRPRDLLLRPQPGEPARTSTSGARSRSRSTGGRSWTRSRRPTRCRPPGSHRRGCPGSTRSIRTRRGRLRAGDLDAAKNELSQANSPKTELTLFYNDSPGHKEIATAVQASWQELGLTTTLKQQEWAQFLEFLGPPPNPAVDVYRSGWIGDYVDAINFLELWTCKSGNNSSNYCDKDYDALVEQARSTQDDQARYEIYAQLEQKLLGEDGAIPVVPIYWYTYPNLEKLSIKDSFTVNLLSQIDLTKVVVREQ